VDRSAEACVGPNDDDGRARHHLGVERVFRGGVSHEGHVGGGRAEDAAVRSAPGRSPVVNAPPAADNVAAARLAEIEGVRVYSAAGAVAD
jgi:hypothetical protein